MDREQELEFYGAEHFLVEQSWYKSSPWQPSKEKKHIGLRVGCVKGKGLAGTPARGIPEGEQPNEARLKEEQRAE